MPYGMFEITIQNRLKKKAPYQKSTRNISPSGATSHIRNYFKKVLSILNFEMISKKGLYDFLS